MDSGSRGDLIVVRPATSEDVPVLVSFWAVAAENETRSGDGSTAVHALLDRDPEALLVAELHDEIVGTVVAGWDGWRGHVYRLAVSPRHRRRGIGTALLTAAEARLRRLGASRFETMLLDGNELGRSMCEAGGYTPQEEWRRWVKQA